MLLELKIKGFAIIDDLSIKFNPGLQLLTGETGAGKSIIIDALSLLFGGKSKPEYVKTSHEKCIITGVFSILSNPLFDEEVRDLLDSEDNYLIIERVLFKDGKSRCWINSKPANLGVLRSLGNQIADFHGQGEQQLLLNNDYNRLLLDYSAGENCFTLKQELEVIFEKLKAVSREKKELENLSRVVNESLELWKFQLSEINNLNIKAGEDEELLLEKNRLVYSQELNKAIELIRECSFSDLQVKKDLYSLTQEVVKQLKSISSIDNKFVYWQNLFYDLSLNLKEFSRFMSDYLNSLDYYPGRLEEVEKRLNEIDIIKKRHKLTTAAEIMLLRDQLENKLTNVADVSHEIDRSEQNLNLLKQQVKIIAEQLTKIRTETAKKITKQVNKELIDLQMIESSFAIRLIKNEEINLEGQDDIVFMLSPHKNDDYKPLSLIASGGELSRVMLALKSVLKEADQSSLLVFDEVDAGIGGRTAEAVGNKLKELSKNHQVLLVTHLPQLAVKADNHFMIKKQITEEGIDVVVKEISGDERIFEISRMLVGDNVTQTTLTQARELLNNHVYEGV